MKSQHNPSYVLALIAAGVLGATAVAQADTPVTVTEISYDANLRPKCTAVRMNPATFAEAPSDACTLKAQGTQGPDRITKTVYDAAGQVTQVVQAVGTSDQRVYSTFSYSPNGKVVDSIDANGNRTRLTYDNFDRQSGLYYPSTTRPSGWNPSTPANALATAGAQSATDFETYSYDANGNRTHWRRRDGNVVRTTYDNLNRSITEWHENGNLIRPIYTTYDLTGAVVKKRFDGFDGPGVTYDYDGLGRLQWSSDMNGRNLSFGYNQASLRNGMVFPDGKNQYYDYDALNRLKYSDISNSGVAMAQTYDALGRVDSRTRWNNTSTNFGYDGVGRLTALNFNFPDTTRNVQWGFSYNPASQITKLTAGNTEQYEYRETASTTDNRTYDGLNRDTGIASLAGGYDARGNMANDGSRVMTYDLYNRLLSVTGNGQNLTMTYDPEGRLASYTANGAVTTFLYDGVKLIGEYNGSNQMQRRYLHGIGTDDPWAELTGATVSASTVSYLYANYQGSIFATANGSGVVADVYKYGPYGEPKNALNQTSFSGSRFRYTGQTTLPEAQLYYYKARVYDPVMGRFLQTDSIGSKDDLNLYAYVGGDPINNTDPTGKFGISLSVEGFSVADYNGLDGKRHHGGYVSYGIAFGINEKDGAPEIGVYESKAEVPEGNGGGFGGSIGLSAYAGNIDDMETTTDTLTGMIGPAGGSISYTANDKGMPTPGAAATPLPLPKGAKLGFGFGFGFAKSKPTTKTYSRKGQDPSPPRTGRVPESLPGSRRPMPTRPSIPLPSPQRCVLSRTCK